EAARWVEAAAFEEGTGRCRCRRCSSRRGRNAPDHGMGLPVVHPGLPDQGVVMDHPRLNELIQFGVLNRTFLLSLFSVVPRHGEGRRAANGVKFMIAAWQSFVSAQEPCGWAHNSAAV